MIDQSLLKIYNASAGSGKTYTLVKEYLSIILQSNDYYSFSRILAITFTNKAAAEMKDRIIIALKEFSSTDPKDWETDLFKSICADLEIQPLQLNERAQKTLSRIIHQYSNFSVSTIDKFTHRLVRNFSQDLGLSSNFEVEMDADKLLNESVEVLLSKLGENQKITNSLVNYSLSKLDEDKSWNIGLDLANTAKILLKEDHQGFIKQIKNHPIEDFTKLRKSIIKQQEEISKKLSEFNSSFYSLINNNGIEKESFSRKVLPGYFDKLIKEDLATIEIGVTLEKQLNSLEFYPKKANEDQKAKIDLIGSQIKSLFEEANEYLNENKGRFILNKLILRTISSLTVINEIERELSLIKEENNILLNSEFNKIISDEIKNQPAPYIYERIGEKYHHYFIDEFQDTSVLQWNNLKPLIENQLSQSGNALIVGDSKQSIYRWRGGDPEQFMSLSSTGDYLPFQTENLETNYRSFKEIINFNNSFYQSAAKSFTNETYKNLYSETTNQNFNDKENGFIEINLIENNKNIDYNSIQLDYIFNSITELIKEGFKYEEITILVRNNKNGIQIAQHLIDNNIPIISKESLLLKNSIEIQVIEKILRIIHVENDYKTRAELIMQLYQNELFNIKTDLHSFINKNVKLNLHEFFNSLEEGGIEFDLDKARSKSLYDLVEYCNRNLRLINEEHNGYIQYFLDFIITYTSRNSNNLHEFLIHWDDKKEKESIVTPSESNAVQIMTIHKSKGLQFPVVILPYADWDAFSDRNAHIWIPLNENKYENFNHFYVPVNKKLKDNLKSGKEILDKNYDQIQLDNLNVLYVATTRAVERLYVSTLHQKNTDKTSIAYYFNQYLDELGIPKSEQFTYQSGNKNRKPKVSSLKQILPIHFYSNEWRSILEISKTAPKFWNTEINSAIEYGNTVHHVLSLINYEKDATSTLKHLLLTGYIPSNQYEEIQIKVNQIIKNKFLNKYFTDEYSIYNEREILFNNKTYRPDRIAIKDNKATIIDYKTGEINDKHKKQLNQYALALENLNYQVDDKLIVYIHDKIEIVNI